MDTRSTASTPVSITRPLVASLLATGLIALSVCGPPRHPLQSWGQLFKVASLYLLMAAVVHTLAVWGVCRMLGRDSDAAQHDAAHHNAAKLPEGRRLIWPLVWVAWIAVVWLPLLSLLANAHSLWVALVEPLTVVFVVLLLRWNALLDDRPVVEELPRGLFEVEETPPLWRLLLPSLMVAVAVEVGPGLLAGDYVWFAGCVFTGGALALLELWSQRFRILSLGPDSRASQRAAAGNSLAVWMLLAMALVPFLAHGYASGMMRGVMAMHAPVVKPSPLKAGMGHSSGYSGIILLQPPKPHDIVAPVPVSSIATLGKPKEISFDGVYWYFKPTYIRPGPDAPVTRGDPTEKNIFSTDALPLVMEAHQPLGKLMRLSCCRALQVTVKNADRVTGRIVLEVELRDTTTRSTSVFLGTEALPSSEVSPMPLHRAPVEDTLTFAIPRSLRGKAFNEITVRIKPEIERARKGPKVAIESFVLEP